MRNLVYRVRPNTPDLPSPGHCPKFWGSNCHATKACYSVGFCHIGTTDAPKGSILVIFDSTRSATCQFGLKIGPNRSPCKPYVKPDDPRKVHHKLAMLNKTPLPRHKVPRIHVQGQAGTHTFISLTAIELKGLPAPGEGLKNCSYY